MAKRKGTRSWNNHNSDLSALNQLREIIGRRVFPYASPLLAWTNY